MPNTITPMTQSKRLRIERVRGMWLVWLAHDDSYTLGTYLRLYDSGMIERVVVRADEGDDIFVLREGDTNG